MPRRLFQGKIQKMPLPTQRGYYSNVRRVPGKNVVVKSFSETMRVHEAKQVKKLHDNYVHLIQRAGVFIPKTELQIIQKPNGNARVRIVQEAIPAEQLVENKLKRCTEKEATEMARLIISETLRVIRFNQTVSVPHYKMIVAVDLKPDNVAIRDGKLVYFDTFSPHLRSVQDPQRVHPVFKRYFDQKGRVLSWLTRHYLSDTVYDPKLRIISTVAMLSKTRPELQTVFIQTARKEVRKQLPHKQANEIIAGLHSGRIAISQAIGKATQYLGKKSKRNIVV